VKDLNLKIRRGAIHALIGPNGAGKSTCFNLLTKFLVPTSGVIFYNGADITAMAPAVVARLGMVRSFQISAVFPQLTVLQNVRIALQRSGGGVFDFLQSARRLRRFDMRAMDLLNSVGLAELHGELAQTLSYGRKRALEIATTLALEPQMVLLDEPTAGMGQEDIRRIEDLIRQVSAQCTVLLVEHNLSVVSKLADRISVLARGEILAEGSYADVSSDSRVREAYLGVTNE